MESLFLLLDLTAVGDLIRLLFTSGSRKLAAECFSLLDGSKLSENCVTVHGLSKSMGDLEACTLAGSRER